MSTLNLRKLKEYYGEGYSPFGKPYDGYYIRIHHGIQSMQGYFTTMMARDEAGFKYPEEFEFWTMDKDAQTYRVLKTNTTDFEKFVVTSALEQGLLNPEKYKPNSENTSSPYRDLIENVYNGEVDKLHYSINTAAFGATGRACQDAFSYHLARKRQGVIDDSSTIASEIYIERMLNEPEYISSEFLKTGDPKDIPWKTRRDNYLSECTSTYITKLIDARCADPISKVDVSLFVPLEIADSVVDDCYEDAKKYTDNYKTVVNQIMSNLHEGIYVEMITPNDKLAHKTPMKNEASVTDNVMSGASTDTDKLQFSTANLKPDINIDALMHEINQQGLTQSQVDKAIMATVSLLQAGYGNEVVPQEVLDREEKEVASQKIAPPTEDEVRMAREIAEQAKDEDFFSY